jgi:hypothetical protein
MIAPHTSGKNMAEFVNDVIGLTAYNIFRPNVAVEEQVETQGLVNQAQEDLQTQAAMPPPPAGI